MKLLRRSSTANRPAMSPVTLGLVGTIVLVMIMVTAYRFDELPFVKSSRNLAANFSEIGGLRAGQKVIVSGARVGKVSDVHIEGGHVRVSFNLDDAKIRLGDKTEARVVTLTLLGEGALELEPHGSGNLSPGTTIPLARTSSPYDITSALSELTTTTSEIDVAKLTRAVGTVSDTLKDTPDDLKGAVTGVTKIARAITDNDDALEQLLSRAKGVTGALADRNAEIATLLKSGDSLLSQLNERQEMIVALLNDAEELADQLSSLVKENRAVLGPALTELNQAVDVLNRNKANIQATIDGLNSYATELGEAVASGPFFDAYIENLTAPATVLPVVSGLLK